jgi:O-antigen/teichoic acid export membrane protein
VIATREVASLSTASVRDQLVATTRSLVGTSGLSFSIIFLLGYPAVLYVLRGQLSAETYPTAAACVRWYWLASGLSILAAVLSGILDGLGAFATRSRIGIIASVTGLAVAIPLIDRWGAIGAALALALQHLLGSAACLIVLGTRAGSPMLLLPRLDKRLLRLAFGDGLNLQGISIVAALLEWSARHFINLLGGLAAVGIFDFSWRVIAQSRNVLSAAALPLLATFASVDKEVESRKPATYARMVRMFVVWSSGLLVVALSVITFLRWTSDSGNAVALDTATILTLGMYPALVSTPAYYGLLGAGAFRIAFLSMMAMLFTLLTGGLTGLTVQSWQLAVVGYSLSYLVGATLLITGFQNRLFIPSVLLPTIIEKLFSGCMIVFTVSEVLSRLVPHNLLPLQTAVVVISILLLGDMLRRYPRHQPV